MPRQDDDFVFTISDNDEDVGLSEEEKEFEPAPASKKRKYIEDAPANSKTKTTEKSKKVKIAASTETTEDQQNGDSGSDDQDWTTKGEDDGALDSDFEFQVDENTGVEEDFDGWASGAKKPAVHQAAAPNKTAVDVDDIIERRRAVAAQKAEKSAKKAARKADEFDGFGSEDDIEEINGHIEMNSEGNDEIDGEEELDDGEDLDGADSGEDDEDEDEEEDDQGDGDSEEAEPVAHPDDLAQDTDDDDNEHSDSEPEDELEAQRRADFFAPESNLDGHLPPSTTNKSGDSFQNMNLSRPILKGLASVGFTSPTPIQSQSIPVALLGKDVVGGAVTGSGKTGAFIIPILERLLYRPKKVPTTRVVVLMPTRELAVQCFNVSKKLASFTDITFALIVGGFSLREQENVLKTRPDVLVATPGRFIDHMRNSPSFDTNTLEILVLDEADRMLEDGFADELNEILTTIPKSRQTMLFSATMTDSVDKLIRVGLNRPVRLMINARKQTVSGLVQEFVRLRPGRETKRLACLLYLCSKVYTERCIIFFRQKKEAHRVRVVFGLCGLKAAELHGSMSQEQRISAVESFRSSTSQFLLATDLASRGLDIKNVSTVINYEAPQTHEIYLHRVGRTARAGRTGRSCTLASEPDRKIVKAAVKAARSQGAKVASRIIPVDAVDQWDEKIEGLADEIEAVLKEEREEKALSIAERDVKRGENLVVHEAEIMARPKRSWFESQAQKTASREAGRRELNPDAPQKAVAGGPKKKLSNKDKKRLALKDERREGGRTWKKGSDVRGKSVLVAPRDKKREKEKKAKEVAKFKKFKAKHRA